MHTVQTSVMSLEESRTLYPSYKRLVRPDLDIHPFEFAAVEAHIQSQLFSQVHLPTPVIWIEGLSLNIAQKLLSQTPIFKQIKGPGSWCRNQHFCLESEEVGSLYLPTASRSFHLLAFGQRNLRLLAICESKLIVADHRLSGKHLTQYRSSGILTLRHEVMVREGLPNEIQTQSIEEISSNNEFYVQFEEEF